MIERLTRRRWPWLLLALLVRVAFALKLGDRQCQIDELGYRATALQLAATGLLGSAGHATTGPPVPAAFFAACFQLGPRLLWPRLAQAFVGVWVAFAIGGMTEELSGSRLAGRLALIVAAVYPFFIYYGGMVLSETLDLALLIPGLWWLCSSLGAGTGAGAGRAAAAGLMLSLAGLCRSEGVFIAAGIWAAATIACAAGRWRARAWLFALACWLLPLLLWCARNRAQLGAFTLDTHAGITLLHGSEFLELNQVDTSLAQEAIERSPFYARARHLPAAQLNRALLRQAGRFMLDHPGLTLRQWAYKLLQFWRFYPRLDKVYARSPYNRPAAGYPRWSLVAISLLFEPWLILGGLWGLWRLRRRWTALFPLYLWVLGTTAIHVVSVSQMRYRLPIMPALILGAAAALAARLERRPS
ncbi:MAG: hypothetical protein KGO96_00225 [Elusimicrobia bacterium]|nr:hypothetical protein [Elusimicrobiota bacterium]MDE2237425.1 hypothetical protein [Elusimicrobiota bacterium]MDE2424319.1 hypothetical protein [Elusimicrobiota bacterium]